VKFAEVLSRVTGLSSPIFGVSWNPPESEVVIARRVFTFLEDRRVLFVPSMMEVPDHCVRSVLEIRHYLTDELQALAAEGGLSESLRAMRAACRKFLDRIGRDDAIIRFGGHMGHWASWEFNGSLGELRGVFGIHVARLAASYGIDVEDDLASILPASDDPPEKPDQP